MSKKNLPSKTRRSYVRIPNGCDSWRPRSDDETFLDQEERLTAEGIIADDCEDEPDVPED